MLAADLVALILLRKMVEHAPDLMDLRHSES